MKEKGGREKSNSQFKENFAKYMAVTRQQQISTIWYYFAFLPLFVKFAKIMVSDYGSTQ